MSNLSICRVTELVIKKPIQFKHNPGDWVFIKIPAIAKYEWHPFTISSAPENKDTFTLHVRGAGNWTNMLYKHYEDIKIAQAKSIRNESIRK